MKENQNQTSTQTQEKKEIESVKVLSFHQLWKDCVDFHYQLFTTDDEYICSYQMKVEEYKIQIINVYVNPEYRGMGFANLLLDLINREDYDKDVYLTVDRENKALIEKYESIGFEYLSIYDDELNLMVKKCGTQLEL